jgi:hypothetical protein
MSVINNLNVDGVFTGITTNKGDILVNNGSSNDAFPVATDGYILSADATQAFGLRWIPNTGGGGPSMTTEINIQPFNFSTNSVIPVVITNTSQTGLSASILFIGTINCTLNHARRYFTIGLYKNGGLIPGTQKTLGGINAVTFPVSIHQTITLMSSDIFDIRINVDNADCEVSIAGIPPYSNAALVNANTIIAINTTSPYVLTDFTFSGAGGIIALIANLNCVLDHAYGMFTVGVYKNGVLIPNSNKDFGGIDTLIFPVTINMVLELVVSDVVSICINSNSTSNMVSIYERTLLRDICVSGMSISPQIALSGPVISTNDTTPYAIPDMTLTGLASGTYIILGELDTMITKARNYFHVGLYLNGSLISGTQKKYGGVDSVRMSIPLITGIAMTPSDVFTVRVSTDFSTYQLNIYERQLTYILC